MSKDITPDIFYYKILETIKRDCHVDLSHYRDKLLKRRIVVRLRATKKESLKEYYGYLKQNPKEVEALFKVMTINVTEFFRDEKVFNLINKKIFPQIIKRKEKTGSNTIRVWSAACATGEEPCSLLLLLKNYLDKNNKFYSIKILATDIDNEALAKAKENRFENSLIKKLSPSKRKLIAEHTNNNGQNEFSFKESFFRQISFKKSDLIRDKAPKNMDLILCRNVFIYFDRELQRQALTNFSNALCSRGFLALGIVESLVPGTKDIFEDLDRETRLFIKR
jgi:chemotaxis methyl-accepting protein methylase